MLGCYFSVCRIRYSLHSSGHIQFDHHRGGIIVTLPTSILGNVKFFGFYDVIRLAGYDSVLCLLPLRRSQEIDRSRYGGNDPPFIGYDLTTEKVYDIFPLRASKNPRRVPS